MSNTARVQQACRWLAWGCVLLLAALSWTPGEEMVRTGFPGQIEHFVAYFGTGLIAAVGYRRSVSPIVIALALCGYAGLLEAGQDWVPGRHANLIDFAASGAGAVAGAAAGAAAMRLWFGRLR